MPPKKRDKDTESSKNPRLEHIQADHELFLQAFESKCFESTDCFELVGQGIGV